MLFEGTTKSDVFVVCVFTITANSPQSLNISIAVNVPHWNNVSHLNISFRKPGHQDQNKLIRKYAKRI